MKQQLLEKRMKRLEKKLSTSKLGHRSSHNLIKEPSVQHIRTSNQINYDSDSDQELYQEPVKNGPTHPSGILDLNRNTFKPDLQKRGTKKGDLIGC